MKSKIFAMLFVSILVAGACSSGGDQNSAANQNSDDSSDSVVLLEPTDFQSSIESNPDAPLINVHIPYEGHIAGTDSFVPFDKIGEWNGLPSDKSEQIVIYCMSGNMSADASKELAALGYTNIVDLEGGMEAWESAGLELEMTEPA